ncbi:MAG: hypothetical protein GY797_00275 [Deltaproteobacteria bacterium]|nr:hypothetical protein [Deltaproteobacteria bacterium]
MNHSVSAFVVNCTKSKAVKVLENGAADKAVDLEKGQAVLKVPGGESELIRLPFPHPSDLLPFLAEHAGPAAQEHALTPDKVINFEIYRNQPPLRQAAH